MNRTVAATLALGVAGFDPLGGFTFMAAAGLGAKRRGLAVLGLVSVAVTAALSVVAVLGLGPWLRRLTQALPHVSHGQLDLGTRVMGVALGGWGIWRLTHRSTYEEKAPQPDARGTRGLAVAGLLVGFSSLIDPAWYAMVAYGAQLSAPVGTVVALVWTVMSHILLVVLCLSLVLGWHDRLTRALAAARVRWATPIWWAVTGGTLAGGALLAALGLHLFGR